ncbi:fatty acid desaturase [Candidatus Woesearchaeota archaeon]|nr:fatty acid desaturase [Candidatus Woesearchaeota archaeon]
MDYVELKKQVVDAGLLERQYSYYAIKAAVTLGLLAVSILILLNIDNLAVQLLNAVLAAFVFVQCGMLMHDAGHRQIFNADWKNTLAGLIAGNLATGTSVWSWMSGHNKHHGSPNDLDEDPDVNIPFLAYSEGQALKKKGMAAFITKYQAFFWLPLMAIAAFSIRTNHTVNLAKAFIKNAKSKSGLYYALEIFLIAVSMTAYFGLIFFSLAWWQALTFFIINYALTGLYIGTVFATNHKGMPLLTEKTRQDFLRIQVLTARNVKGSPLIDLWTGGLNYQIEHHLFPTMPRNNLSKARALVKLFCNERGIEYYETGFFRSYKEILQNFHRTSAVLRKPRANGGNAVSAA